MNKKKLKGKFVKVYHGNVFDKYLIFGTIIKVDELGNLHLKIKKLFHKTFFHEPRLFWWNPFFPKKEVVWYDCREKDDDWNYHPNDIITFQLKYSDWRLAHEISLSDDKECEELKKKIDDLEKIKGGWFGFP